MDYLDFFKVVPVEQVVPIQDNNFGKGLQQTAQPAKRKKAVPRNDKGHTFLECLGIAKEYQKT